MHSHKRLLVLKFKSSSMSVCDCMLWWRVVVCMYVVYIRDISLWCGWYRTVLHVVWVHSVRRWSCCEGGRHSAEFTAHSCDHLPTAEGLGLLSSAEHCSLWRQTFQHSPGSQVSSLHAAVFEFLSVVIIIIILYCAEAAPQSKSANHTIQNTE